MYQPLPSQLLKRGQAGEGAAGDAGDDIGRESSSMERITDQCMRGRVREFVLNGGAIKERILYDFNERKRD